MTQRDSECTAFRRPLDPVLRRARCLLRRYYVLHEMTLQGLDLQRGHLSAGLLRWLAGAPVDSSRREVISAIESEIFEWSLTELDVPDGWKDTTGRLVALCRRLGFGPDEENLVCLLLAMEVSPEVLWVARALSGGSPLRGLDIRFVRAVLDPWVERPWSVAKALGPDSPLVRYGLLLGGDEEASEPPSDGLHLRPSLVRYLLGHPWTDRVPGIRRSDPDHSGWKRLAAISPFPASFLEEVENAAIEEGEIVVFSSPRGAGAGLLIRLVCLHHHLPLVEVDIESLIGADQPASLVDQVLRAAMGEAVSTGAFCLLHHAEAILRQGMPTTTTLYSLLENLPVPAALTVAPHSEAALLARVPLSRRHRMTLSIPDSAERERLWFACLSRRLDTSKASQFATGLRGYPLGREQIVEVSEGSVGEMDLEAFRAAAAEATGHRLGTLAVRVPSTATWDQVVLPARTLQSVRELLAHAKHLKQVLDEWRFGSHLRESSALSALFSGPPGTGKTLVAGLIARELGVELYRVDLSRVVSKYVGETEERLARLFDEARVGGVCLLFDEADALFSRRTEVRSSVDRYANLEVDFLLQKMDEFDGVTLLTTNFPQSIDEAFLRRIKFRIVFPKPDVEERIRLWRSLIPKEAPLANDVRFEALAEAYEFTGAEIRNAVLRAAFLAAECGRSISQEILDRAARIECEQSGRVVTRVAFGEKR